MASANYVTWYLVEMCGAMAGGSHFHVCKTPQERDDYVSALCEKIADMRIPNCDRPRIDIRIDRHEVPNGPLM